MCLLLSEGFVCLRRERRGLHYSMAMSSLWCCGRPRQARAARGQVRRQSGNDTVLLTGPGSTPALTISFRDRHIAKFSCIVLETVSTPFLLRVKSMREVCITTTPLTPLACLACSWQAVPEIGTITSCSRTSSADGVAEVIVELGKRASHSLPSGSTTGTVLHFFAVYDGHGGPEVSNHCARCLHGHLRSNLQECSSQTPTPTSLGNPTSTPVDTVQTALLKAFKQTDNEVAPPHGPGADIGSTAVVALLGSQQLWIANCGR
jgi:Protein phosphatase 2C